jgi:tRNA(Arg) A34 adenosine deaminase TadA
MSRNDPQTPSTREEQLAGCDFRALEHEVIRKRLAWLDEHGYDARTVYDPGRPPILPRRAFELLFADYMGVDLGRLPIEEESGDRITWLSLNPCSRLDACVKLGLDTRTVCRAVYEKPVQFFLSRLDPSLRFVRDYEQIRPHAPHCRESIVRVDLQDLMRQALEEARLSRAAGGGRGYGAVLVMGDKVIARAHDSTGAECDPSRHGELKAISEAARRLGTLDLSGALLVSTCEPCPMCAGLAVWANVTTVVYGSSIEDTAAMGRTRIMVGMREIAERSPYSLEVLGGVLTEDCDRLYS